MEQTERWTGWPEILEPTVRYRHDGVWYIVTMGFVMALIFGLFFGCQADT